MNVEQKNVTRNQSQADYTQSNVFIFDNRYQATVFNNVAAAAEFTIADGNLLYKTAAGEVDVATEAADIEAIVGIAAIETPVVVANAATLDINMGIQGTISEENLLLNGLTLETLIPTTQLTLRDHLQSLGFVLDLGVENTKHDNS